MQLYDKLEEKQGKLLGRNKYKFILTAKRK